MSWPLTRISGSAESMDATIIILASSLLLLVTLSTLYVYYACLHPLARIPGPRVATCSNIWLAYHAKNGRLAELGRTLHGQYGEAVRVGPNEVWFNSRTAFKAIYSAGNGFDKSDFYLATVLQRPDVDWRLRTYPADTLDLLSERDMQRYRLQRRLIGPTYRPANVVKYEKQVDKIMTEVIKTLTQLQGTELDLKEWMHIIAVECLGAVVLSWSPGMLRKGTDSGTSAHGYQSWKRKTVFGLFPLMARIEMGSSNIGRAFSLLWGVNFKTPTSFRPFFPYVGRRIGRRLKAALQKGELGDDLMSDLIKLHQEKPVFNEVYLRKMAMTNFGAGHETMTATLTSILTMLGTHPWVQKQLADELHNIAQHNSFAEVGQLPYLQAVIKESKRLYPVIGTALPRVVPASGVHISGVFLPGGTTVGCNPIALHRNEDICGPLPNEFKASRWLGNDQQARDLEIFSLAWGGGARTCPGRHLAEMIVCKVVAAICQDFDVEITSRPDDGDMPSYFLSMMTGVKARLTRRKT